MITVKRFRRIEQAVRQAGFGDIIDWSETIAAPPNADAFATGDRRDLGATARAIRGLPSGGRQSRILRDHSLDRPRH